MPTRLSAVAPRPTQVRCRMAAMSPSGTPMSTATPNASPQMIRVGPREWTIIGPTSPPNDMLSPRSPWMNLPSQRRYWIGSGWSRPNSAFSSAMTSGGSGRPSRFHGLPGAACMIANATIEAPSTMGTTHRRRRTE